MFFCENHWKFWTFSILYKFETNFLKNANHFKKLEYYFLVESTKTDNTAFPYKTALSEATFKIKRMESTKWTYNKWVLPVTTFFFWKFCFSLRTSYKELIWCINYPNIRIHTFRKRWSFIWECFSLCISISVKLSLKTCQKCNQYYVKTSVFLMFAGGM